MSLDPNAGGVAVNWRMFGSSGYEQKPRGGCSRASYGVLKRMARATSASRRL
jgi:hypothetical protein